MSIKLDIVVEYQTLWVNNPTNYDLNMRRCIPLSQCVKVEAMIVDGLWHMATKCATVNQNEYNIHII